MVLRGHFFVVEKLLLWVLLMPVILWVAHCTLLIPVQLEYFCYLLMRQRFIGLMLKFYYL
jgi:hypothetical protein